MSGLPLYIPVMIYCESPLNAQSQTHRCAVSFNSVIKVKSAVRHILAVGIIITQTVICSRHDKAEEIVLLSLNNNPLL
jgi:hypothetical protein